MNGVPNVISREGDATGDIGAFRELTQGLRRLESERLIRVDVLRRREKLSEPIPEDTVSVADFLNAAEQGYKLERRPDPAGYVLTGERTHYVLAIEPSAWGRPELSAAIAAFGIPSERVYYEIDPGIAPDAQGLRLVTRSVLGAMAYLSNAVRVPNAHSEFAGVAGLNGESELSDLLDVRVSDDPATAAYIAVEHRGYWFYIDDRDVQSKRTFGLLTSLMRMSINAGGAQNVPLLTLPVSR